METEDNAPKRPTGLKKAGKQLWDSIIPAYTLRPDEIRVLEDACRLADTITRLEAEQNERPLIAKGSMGQEVISPMIPEIRQYRTSLNALLKSLKLPDSASGAQQKKDYNSDQARKAARARWGQPRGA